MMPRSRRLLAVSAAWLAAAASNTQLTRTATLNPCPPESFVCNAFCSGNGGPGDGCPSTCNSSVCLGYDYVTCGGYYLVECLP